MKRHFLFYWYQTPRGKLLQQAEVEFIQRSIMVGCKQTILQLGSLGWENEFIDCSLYEKFTILDGKGMGWHEARHIKAKSYTLPIQSNSIDMIILPHLLEFDAYRFHTMREVERVLKPEGELLIINFNPWSLSVRYQHLLNRKMAESWRGHFIPRKRVLDWLKLLNFEVKMTAEFGLDSVYTRINKPQFSGRTLLSAAYAIKAVKRRYHLIPLTPVKARLSRLAISGAADVTHRIKKNG